MRLGLEAPEAARPPVVSWDPLGSGSGLPPHLLGVLTGCCVLQQVWSVGVLWSLRSAGPTSNCGSGQPMVAFMV